MNMMKKLPFFLLLILLLEITISAESQSPALLKYVLQWPPTFCIDLHSQGKGTCKVPVPQHKFTLHGLMQADEQGHNIKCHPDKSPNWNELFGPLKSELVKFWPSLREDFNETEFWKHEWRSHGACGGVTPEEYFYTAIEINKKPQRGNLFNYLHASGIVPSLGYPKEYIVEAIQKVFYESGRSPHHNIYLSCVPINTENTNHVYLSEVTLCTNLYGSEFISCPLQADPASCPDGAYIVLPLPQQPQEASGLPLDSWKTPMGNILRHSTAEIDSLL